MKSLAKRYSVWFKKGNIKFLIGLMLAIVIALILYTMIKRLRSYAP